MYATISQCITGIFSFGHFAVTIRVIVVNVLKIADAFPLYHHFLKVSDFNPLSTNLTKWSNTLKQFVGIV